ncbi:MAG: hypothetical protein AUK44_05845 [Porphyromonadaceae bacterium CG2_30_38_12]|nr:MAG: hypothetical protein AUK44_05845 [Porphyromonadaceae bacterium CG2_30_38_12]
MEKLGTIGINDLIFTEGLVQQTSMCNSQIRSISEAHRPIHFIAVRQRIRPQTAKFAYPRSLPAGRKKKQRTRGET